MVSQCLKETESSILETGLITNTDLAFRICLNNCDIQKLKGRVIFYLMYEKNLSSYFIVNVLSAYPRTG